MNQKYLQGISSDMENLDSAVFFEATPENISAFLAQHRWAHMAAIGTIKDQSFLTARMGLIDTCPDQEYLAKKILPIYAKVQMGDIHAPKLKTVQKRLLFLRNAQDQTGITYAGMVTVIKNIRTFSVARLLLNCSGMVKWLFWIYRFAPITMEED